MCKTPQQMTCVTLGIQCPINKQCSRCTYQVNILHYKISSQFFLLKIFSNHQILVKGSQNRLKIHAIMGQPQQDQVSLFKTNKIMRECSIKLFVDVITTSLIKGDLKTCEKWTNHLTKYKRERVTSLSSNKIMQQGIEFHYMCAKQLSSLLGVELQLKSGKEILKIFIEQ